VTTHIPRKGRLFAEVPTGRFRVIAPYNRAPEIGDIVQLDQGFSDPNGQNMTLVYCVSSDGSFIYEAEIYDSEFELVNP